MTWWFTTFMAPAIKQKVHNLQGVEYLYSVMSPDQLEIPAYITEYDMSVSLFYCFICFALFLCLLFNICASLHLLLVIIWRTVAISSSLKVDALWVIFTELFHGLFTFYFINYLSSRYFLHFLGQLKDYFI